MPRRSPLPVPLVVAFALLLGGPALAVAQEDPLQASTKTINVELILDASGSMAEVLPDGEPRIDAARRVLRGVIDAVPERAGVNLGFRVYGHRGDNTEAGKPASCRSSDLLVPVRGVDKAELRRQIDAFQPTGWTPIAYALEQARLDFQPGGESVTNAIVLVTDGEETCDPPQQACDAAATLRGSDVTVTTHVVGFALTPEQTDLVRCVAEQGGGRLFGAADAAALGGALVSALEDVEVLPPGSAAAQTGPVAAAVPLSDVRTLVYHQITTWAVGPDEGYGGGGERAPILSDDGQRIAFGRTPGDPNNPANPNRIFVLNADGSGEREIDAYTPLCYCNALLDISADGSRVVSSDLVQLRIADAAGGGGRELVAIDSNEINAIRITADGNRVFFRVYRDPNLRGRSPSVPVPRGVYVVNADGSGLRRIVGPEEMAPVLGVPVDQVPFFGGSWGMDVSADGSRVLFASFTADIDPVTGSAREGLFAVNGDGSGLHRLLAPDFSYVHNGAISGDGATIAYVTGDFGTAYQEAGVLGFDGANRRKLTDSNERRHPGIGATLPSGERIQLSADGSRLLLGSSGLLYDTADGGVLPLALAAAGVAGDPAPLVYDGTYRVSMNAGASRFLYLVQPPGEPYQLATLDLNQVDPGAAPSLTDARIDPPFVLTEARSLATVSARVSTGNSFLRVSPRVLRDGLPDTTVSSDYDGPMVDDGTNLGDATAGDGVFTTDRLGASADAAVGPRAVRIKAETRAADGTRHATAVDVVPFAVTDDEAAVAPTPPPATGPATATVAAPTVPPALPTATAAPTPTAVPAATPAPSPTPVPTMASLTTSTPTATPPPIEPTVTPAPLAPSPPIAVPTAPPIAATVPATAAADPTAGCSCAELAAARATIAAQSTRIAEQDAVLARFGELIGQARATPTPS